MWLVYLTNIAALLLNIYMYCSYENPMSMFAIGFTSGATFITAINHYNDTRTMDKN